MQSDLDSVSLHKEHRAKMLKLSSFLKRRDLPDNTLQIMADYVKEKDDCYLNDNKSRTKARILININPIGYGTDRMFYTYGAYQEDISRLADDFLSSSGMSCYDMIELMDRANGYLMSVKYSRLVEAFIDNSRLTTEEINRLMPFTSPNKY